MEMERDVGGYRGAAAVQGIAPKCQPDRCCMDADLVRDPCRDHRLPEIGF